MNIRTKIDSRLANPVLRGIIEMRTAAVLQRLERRVAEVEVALSEDAIRGHAQARCRASAWLVDGSVVHVSARHELPSSAVTAALQKLRRQVFRAHARPARETVSSLPETHRRV